jgi:hypothetical protein
MRINIIQPGMLRVICKCFDATRLTAVAAIMKSKEQAPAGARR